MDSEGNVKEKDLTFLTFVNHTKEVFVRFSKVILANSSIKTTSNYHVESTIGLKNELFSIFDVINY